jgi:hypothetical protein
LTKFVDREKAVTPTGAALENTMGLHPRAGPLRSVRLLLLGFLLNGGAGRLEVLTESGGGITSRYAGARNKSHQEGK